MMTLLERINILNEVVKSLKSPASYFPGANMDASIISGHAQAKLQGVIVDMLQEALAQMPQVYELGTTKPLNVDAFSGTRFGINSYIPPEFEESYQAWCAERQKDAKKSGGAQ